jgi:DNA-directed RNA polymerase
MNAIMKTEYKRRAEFQKKMDCMKTMRMKVENKRRAQAQKEMKSMKIMAVEDRHTAHF